MAINIRDILQQKISEIQGRVPIAMNGTTSSVPFQEYLDQSSTASVSGTGSSLSTATSSQESGSAIDKEGNDRSQDVERARLSRMNSKAYIPSDKNQLMDMINQNIQVASQKYGVDANLIRSVIRQESGFDPYSLSHTGAQGLMQLMPGTADGLQVTDPWDISQNIEGGTRYLKYQLDNFGGDMQLALAAYNAGPNSVRKYNGVPPYTETQNYVSRVMDYYSQYTGIRR